MKFRKEGRKKVKENLLLNISQGSEVLRWGGPRGLSEVASKPRSKWVKPVITTVKQVIWKTFSKF